MSDKEWENRFGTRDAAILAHCKTLGAELNLGAEDLGDEWESWSIVKKIKKVSIDALQRFRVDYLKENGGGRGSKAGISVKRESGYGLSSGAISYSGAASSSMEVDDLDSSANGSGNSKKRGRSAVLSEVKTNSGFSKRTDRLKVVRSFAGDDCAKWSGKKFMGVEVKLDPRLQPLERGYSWNYNAESQMRDMLERRLESVSNVVLANSSLPAPSSSASRQETYTSIGMIMSGRDGGGTALDYRDVFLTNFKNKPSRLDLLDVHDRALFRGQIVVVRGTNPQDRRLKVEKNGLFTAAAPDPRLITEAVNVVRSHELHIMMAAGPFSTEEDLAYEPLQELLVQVKLKQPNVLVLIGPFVDDRHPQVASASCESPFSEIHQSVMDKVDEALRSLGVYAPQLLIIPSLRDVTHQCVLPQPPFTPSPGSKATYLPNPATFSLNSLHFGISSTDILSDLRPNSLLDGAFSLDPQNSLTASILQQRSFYPLYPPPSHVPIDAEHAEMGLSIPHHLDLCVFVSSTPPFADKFGSILAVNIGTLVTNDGQPGTFAEIKIAQSEPSITSLIKRSQVEIIRI
jgi:hypothetical protein